MLSFANATGNLYNRLGKVGLLASQLRSYQNSQLTNMTDPNVGVVSEYDSESDLQAEMGDNYISILANTSGVIGGVMQQLAQDTINRMIFRDNPRLNQTLTQSSILLSMQEVIRQMKVAGATVLAMTITATPSGFSNGITNASRDGVINASVKRPLDGMVLENSYAESILLTCTRDSYTGGAIVGNETFTVTGTGYEQDLFAFDWPLGSNCQASLNSIDGNANNSSGNLLYNSGFANWTSNVPDRFTLVTGTAGTNIAEETVIVFDGSTSAMKITGDAGGTLTTIKQQFSASTTGTPASLSPQTQYSFNLFIRRDGVIPANGQLTVDLVDSNNVVIQDANGINNTFTIDLTQLTVIYTPYTGVFRTPTVLPTQSFIRIGLTTALPNGRSVYVDKMSFGVMTQTYTSGPYLAVHSGATPFILRDYGNCVITNSRGSGGTLNTFQTLMARLVPLVYSYELLLPSSATPTIVDSTLIA